MSFVEELSWRGLVHQQTDSELGKRLAALPHTIYAGFDPTADSLHIGHLVPIMALVRAQRAGHRPIALVGGATGMIGDPSGKSQERNLLDEAQLARNVAGVRAQLERFIEFGPGAASLVNNYDWMKDFSYLGFLRDVGKSFSVNMMLAKDSVASRIEKEQGISYTEFSYMLLQSYDFLHLYREYDCRVQIGGSDQWGNITAGIDLVRRLAGGEAFGLTMPLVTTSGGQKFGKTEKGAVWLDEARTSAFELYQFFRNTEDADVARFLRFYTLLDAPTIAGLEESLRAAPEKREAHRVLAREVTTLIHGAIAAQKAEDTAGALFARRTGQLAGAPASATEPGLDGLADAAVAILFIPPEAPSTSLARTELGGGQPLAQLLVRSKLCVSNGAARRDIQGGGIYLNESRVEDPMKTVAATDFVDGKLLLRKGKRSYHVLVLTE